MTTPQVKTRTNFVSRAAFTLVEMMVVILIIGILAAIATPFIFGALTRAREFTIENEMVQLNAAVERFNTDHGFYPPAIGPGLEIDPTASGGQAAFRRYLNRIAPNNAEATSGGLAKWWDDVGQKLNQSSSLVFWLSGLCTSKQYPLSGNATFATSTTLPALAPYNANKFSNDADFTDEAGNPVNVNVDRNVFFDFKLGQLASSVPATPGIKLYNQPTGKGDFLAYNYRDFRSYITASSGNAYHRGVDATTNAPVNFFNPTSFQIVGPGMDGAISNNAPTEINTDLIDETQVDPGQDDNITNFSGGRLEKSYP